MVPTPERKKKAAQVSNGKSNVAESEQTRHIPWPEIFKRHISMIEGHLRMIEMVRKHTEQGSENHRSVCDMIDRTKELLQQSKISEESVVHGQVPDKESHQNKSLPSAGAESPITSEKLKEMEQPTEKERAEALDGLTEPEGQMFFMDSKPTPIRGILTNAPSTTHSTKPSKSSEQNTSADPDAAKTGSPSSILKRKASDASTSSPHNTKKSKQAPTALKRKASSDSIEPSRKKLSADPSSIPAVAGETIIDPTTTQGETEDITSIVDARMAAREERRKRKKENRKGEKRKRESDASALDQALGGGDADAATIPDKEMEPEQKRIRPTKEKEKKRKRESEGSAIVAETSVPGPTVDDGESKGMNRKPDGGTKQEKAVHADLEKPRKKKIKATEKETAERHTLSHSQADRGNRPSAKK
ncbi:MAG: hypothetical protein Q9174_005750, partial [Haloplaca sp. 1 TL-2023]